MRRKPTRATRDKALGSLLEGLITEATKEGLKLKDSVRDTVEKVGDRLALRDNVVMVRVDKETLARLDELVDAGLVGSRSEAAAAMISEGVKARQPLFEQIAEKVARIREMKEELKGLMNEEPS